MFHMDSTSFITKVLCWHIQRLKALSTLLDAVSTHQKPVGSVLIVSPTGTCNLCPTTYSLEETSGIRAWNVIS